MSRDPQILLRRLATFAKRQGSAKELAKLTGCDIRTAEKMREGASWPSARHMLGLFMAFGDDFLEAVFYPERAKSRLEREIADLERQLQQRQAALELADEEARSFAPRRQKARARHENRAAALAAGRGAR